MPTVREIIEQNPEYVIGLLLKAEFWPTSLQVEKVYERFEDDNVNALIGVSFLKYGDGWIQVLTKPDPDQVQTEFRFRMEGAGGQSPHVRNALLILALAIDLDNEEHPQHRG